MPGMIAHELRYETAGRSLRYLDTGEGRPLVLLHAFPLSADMWAPQIGSLPPGWRLIAPDLRGFRGVASPADPSPVGPVTMDDYARDVLALLDHLRIPEAVVGGLSMGGYVTFAVCRLAPERVRGVLLANTRPQADTDEGRAQRRQMIALVAREGAAGVAREMAPKLLGRTTQRERPEVTARVRALIEANSTDAISSAIGALMTRPDSTPMLESMRAPAIVVVGMEDMLIPREAADLMFDTLPNARLSVIARAGHLSNLEEPDLFNAFLGKFLTGNF
jgi:pimeloyl-ACP methyl ester carboxylesterase